MNEQEVFDKVYRHLITQGARALENDEPGAVCQYRAPDGKRCAIGCLIPDEMYHPKIEGRSSGNLQIELPGFIALFDRDFNFNLLRKLQSLHDFYPVREWRQSLAYVAKKFGLTVPVMS